MKIVEVKLKNFNKTYLFECSNNLIVKTGNTAICKTVFGIMLGEVKDIYYMSNNCKDIITLRNAQFPLKRILAVFSKEVELIVIENYIKKLTKELMNERIR